MDGMAGVGCAAAAVAIFYLGMLGRASSHAVRPGLAGAARALALGAAACGCSLLAATHRGLWELALWPAACLALLAAGYAGAGGAIFLKRRGRIAWPAGILLLPYRLPLWLLRAVQARRDAQARAEVVPGLWIGRMPSRHLADAWMQDHPGILDLTAEHTALAVLRQSPRYVNLPLLEGIAPGAADLAAAADAIARLRADGMVLVLCGRGRSRSAAAIIAFLRCSGTVASIDDALARVQAARPQARLRSAARIALAALPPLPRVERGGADTQGDGRTAAVDP